MSFGIVSRWRRGMQELYEKDAPQTGDIVIQLYNGGPHSLVVVGHKTFVQWAYGDTEYKTYKVNKKKATTDAHNKRIYRIDNRLRSILNSYSAEDIVKRAESQISKGVKAIKEKDNCEDFVSWCVFGVDKGVTNFVFQDEYNKAFNKSQEPKTDIQMRIRVVNDRGESYTAPTVDIINILGESLASDKTTKKGKEQIGVKPYKIGTSDIWKLFGFEMLKVFGSALKPGGNEESNGFKANAKEVIQTKRALETYNNGVIYNEGFMETSKDKNSGKKVQTGVFVTKVHTWAKGDIWICVAPCFEREALMTYHLRMEDYLDQKRNKPNAILVLNADTAQDVCYE
ncbi:hypothetical protein DdX_20002 [Ditylenchus destructor]|uniref:LRAT domain-containing protein n=1 Tax=Ditylenchus destructor TaxID=166010 RepID=A0AAD4QWT4_9BILA|nr:hypothetical protein DdX_20002 [Ditylenchus destructor]